MKRFYPSHGPFSKKLELFLEFKTEEQGDCLIWLGAKNYAGRAQIRKDGRTYLVSRAIWEQYIGAIPQGFGVLHRCNNASCVRLAHLYVGDQSTNLQQASREGRLGRKKSGA